MRDFGIATMLILGIAAAPASADVPAAEVASRLLHPPPSAHSRQVYAGRTQARFGRSTTIRTVEGGGRVSPFVAALPGEVWRGRVRRFGATDGVGFSGTAVRARSIGLRDVRSEKHVSGFLASDLRYGIAVDGDDLLTLNLATATQRLPALAGIGRGKSIRVGSLYLGAALIHDRRVELDGGWYRVTTSKLSPLDHAVERTAGMPPAGEGLRLALDWRLGQRAAPFGRIGLELRDGTADRDQRMLIEPTPGRDRRALIHFIAPF
jgi:hypothetical protein